jgi:hypothetical protein
MFLIGEPVSTSPEHALEDGVAAACRKPSNTATPQSSNALRSAPGSIADISRKLVRLVDVRSRNEACASAYSRGVNPDVFTIGPQRSVSALI